MLLGLSGGVDSSVVAALLHRAIDVQLTCVFFDTGLLGLALGADIALAPLAVLTAMTGALVERWLFFAEAKHTVTLYYGARAA